MKFICPCETLRKEISYASNFTTKRNALSITSNVLLENKNNTLTIKATDTKNGFISSIEVSTIVPGSTTVLCEKFLDVLKNINGDVDLEISQENDNLSIKNSNESKFVVNMRTVDSDKFPEISQFSYCTISGISQKKGVSISPKFCLDNSGHFRKEHVSYICDDQTYCFGFPPGKPYRIGIWRIIHLFGRFQYQLFCSF